jgi:serpin B
MPLVIASATYLSAVWKSPFDATRTKKEVFTLFMGQRASSVNVAMMNHSDAYLAYTQTDDIQVLEMAYLGGNLAMDILLPREASVSAFERLEASLNAQTLADLLGQVRPRRVQVSLPRFRVASTLRLDETFRAMGIIHALAADQADLSGISARKPLFLGFPVHQAFVEVNERGTEAGAASAFGIANGGRPPVFRADHPFVFLIRDKRSNSVLFLGRIMNPNE